jgi:hypothetical protein
VTRGTATLIASWLLLFNPKANGLQGGQGEWETVRHYDTLWLCEQGRREDAAERAEEAAKKDDAKWPLPSGPRAPDSGNLAALLQYRCEHERRASGRR